MMTKIIELPKSEYRILPDRQPAPSRARVALTLLAIVGVSVLFAIGVMI